MSFRRLQIESLLRRTISTVLTQKLSDPRIEGMISVTKVTVSPDFHDAYVYVSVLPEKFEAKTLHGLRHAAKYIHRLIADEVSMGSVPLLDFRVDHALKKEAQVLLALRRAKEHDDAASGAADADPQAVNNADSEPAASVSEPAEPQTPDEETDTDARSAEGGRSDSSKPNAKEKSRPRQRRVSGDALDETAKPDRRRKNSTRPRKDPH